MNDLGGILFALPAGAVLGGMFFGGLWWTIRRGLSSRIPAAWFAISSLLRIAITLAGFYLVIQGDWRRLIACMAGFIGARVAVQHLSRVRHITRI